MLALQQGALFGHERPALDGSFSGLAHQTLSHGAWVDYCSGWLEGHQSVMESLAESAAWRQQRRRMYDSVVDVPRLIAPAPTTGLAAGLLQDASRMLSRRYGLELGSISLAWYRDGSDSVAMHGDRVGRLAPDTVVAILATGAARRFLMRSNDRRHSLSFQCGWGDLLVMGGTAQTTWQHGVPKVPRSGPRISIMFRPG